jgi:hypothetical protein
LNRRGVHRVAPGDIGLRLAGPFSPVRDPLNRASRHAELRRDLVKAGTARSRQSVTDSLFDLGWHL